MQRKSSLFAAAALSAGMIASPQAMAGGSTSDQINDMSQKATDCLDNYAADEHMTTLNLQGESLKVSMTGNLACVEEQGLVEAGKMQRDEILIANPSKDGTIGPKTVVRFISMQVTAKNADFSGQLKIASNSHIAFRSANGDIVGLNRADTAVAASTTDVPETTGQDMSAFFMKAGKTVTIANNNQMPRFLTGSYKPKEVSLTAPDVRALETANATIAGAVVSGYYSIVFLSPAVN